MKNKLLFLLFLSGVFFLAACQAGNAAESETIENFSNNAVSGLKETAKFFSNEDYQAGDVPLNEYIKMNGVITKTDGNPDEIQNGDRLMIENDGVQYQVFNQQATPLKIGDTITVYGEYYGFIKGTLIEIEGE
ncbi:hypothetical protein [Enterococcus sp. LJL90]